MPLLGTKQAENPALLQQGQVSEGAKRASAADDVAGPQAALRQGRVGQVMRTQGRWDGVDQVTAVGMELYQQMGRREATTVGLVAALAVVRAQVGRVRLQAEIDRRLEATDRHLLEVAEGFRQFADRLSAATEP